MLKRITHVQTQFILKNMAYPIEGVKKPTDLHLGMTYLMPTGCKLRASLPNKSRQYHLIGYGDGWDIRRLVKAVDDKDPIIAYHLDLVDNFNRFNATHYGLNHTLDEIYQKGINLYESGNYASIKLSEQRLIAGFKIVASWEKEEEG